MVIDRDSGLESNFSSAPRGRPSPHFQSYDLVGRRTESESEVAQSCPTLCDPLDCSLPGFSVHGILQARILEWVTISFPRGIFLTQGSNQCLLNLLHWQVGSLSAEPPGKLVQLRDQFLYLLVITLSNPLASAFDSSFKSHSDNKSI